MAEQKPKPNDFPTLKGDKDKIRWDEAADKRSISFLFREQIIEDRFIQSCLKNTKKHLIGEQICDPDQPEEFWTTIRNVQDVKSLDILVNKALADVSKFNPKFKFDLFLEGDRIDHLDSGKFSLMSHTKKVWGVGNKRPARLGGAVPARKAPATTEELDETDETKSKKARKSYAETAPIIKSIGVLFQDRSSQNKFWLKCTERDGALKEACALAACDPSEPTSFFVRLTKPQMGTSFLEQLLKSAMATFNIAMMESGGQSGPSKFDVMLEFSNDKESIRKNDQDPEDFDLKQLLHSI